MNYIGSKLSLLQFLENSINQVVKEKDYVFSDLFAGTGTVGKYFKQKGYRVIANDLQYYSYVLSRHYIGNHTDLYFVGLVDDIPGLFVGNVNTYKNIVCEYLDNLTIKTGGYIYANYSMAGTANSEFQRQYFSDHNSAKCDTIRNQIEDWKNQNKLTDDEYYFLLATLLEAIDKVANTASVYGAFLKQLKKSAQKEMTMKPLDIYINDHDHYIYNQDINELIKNTEHDVVYLDPPYNHRQYSGNYHILETIAKNDNPIITGKTGMRNCKDQKSLFCSKTQVVKAYQELINNTNAKYIFLSYNDEGLMTLDEIKNIMSARGEYGVFTQEYQRFKADKTENRDHKKSKVIEYLHYVKIR